MKKFGKMSTTFVICLPDLGYIPVFKKIEEKLFDSFLTNQGKNEDEDEEIQEN